MIPADHAEYRLEFLLAFDGRIHHLEEGYSINFEIDRVEIDPHSDRDRLKVA